MWRQARARLAGRHSQVTGAICNIHVVVAVAGHTHPAGWPEGTTIILRFTIVPMIPSQRFR